MCVDVTGRQPILISKRSDQDRKSDTGHALRLEPLRGASDAITP
jgi:hypothetical protein